MHGIVHSQLKNFVETKYGASSWTNVISKAGLENKIYLTTKSYPDKDILAIVKAASEATTMSAGDLLEAFGKFLFPIVAKTYEQLIKPEWRTFDFLLNIEDTIHTVVRRQIPESKPPQLRFKKVGPNQLILNYNSPRRLQSLAKGMMLAVAERYGEKISFKATKTQNGFDIMITIS